jgi:hypothetical protein
MCNLFILSKKISVIKGRYLAKAKEIISNNFFSKYLISVHSK